MIARVTKGHGFAGLARYLETGRDDADRSDRVTWTEARNLPTEDPHTASVLMRATAAQSDRTEKPVYHVALSFNPEDSVDRATMVQVADRLMNDLGLREHQALIIAHGDTRHPHVHLMINRVHPETFRAWHTSHDYARVERSLREQERELGFRAVSGRHYRLDGQERPDQAEALAMNGDHQRPRAQTHTEQAPRAHEAPERQTTGRNVGEVVRPSPSPARGADLTHLPADGRAAPVNGREDRPAERKPDDRSSPDRGHATRAPVESPQNPPAQRSADDQNTRAGREPVNPAPGGPEPARPDRARADRGDSGRTSRDVLNPRLESVRRTINSLERRTRLERTRDTTRDELDRAHMRLLPHTAQRAEARQASARLRDALAEVYRDPVAARRAFHARAEQVGAPAAAAELARHAGRFGELRGTQVGPVRSAERTTALRSARKLETLGPEHIRRVRDAWAHRADYRRERSTVVQLDRRLKTINHQLDRTPRRDQLEQRLARQLRGLEAPHRQALQRSLPIPHRRLVAAATMIGREFAHEQGHER